MSGREDIIAEWKAAHPKIAAQPAPIAEGALNDWMFETIQELRHTVESLKGQVRSLRESPQVVRVTVCFYCGARCEATKDHFIPFALGGRQGLNLVGACERCNARKGGRLPTRAEILRFITLCAQRGIRIYEDVLSDGG